MSTIRLLEWDTKFFGYRIGESAGLPDLDEAKTQNYRLIYVRSQNPLDLDLFCDHKVTFFKKISPKQKVSNEISSAKGTPLDDTLLDLAILSGSNSRFKLDQHFKSHEFEKLYTEWITKSLNGALADQVFIHGADGLVTVKIKNGEAHIGLIAVSLNSQGKGIGKKLLMAAENFAFENGASMLYVPTQEINVQACKFYENYGFTRFSEELTYHLWIN